MKEIMYDVSYSKVREMVKHCLCEVQAKTANIGVSGIPSGFSDFKHMYADKIGKREERIKNLSTDELLEEFKDKKSGNVSLIRNEMKFRYKENMGDDKIKITMAFKELSPGDQAWIEHQERKEMYGKE